ncbi:MAG: PD-(D/E)XK nuclease family protein, partial [Bacteroidales bacterium]|nr:PD-(D/E)XK nuclease family protein [Bacteroidales bacterium]
KNTDKNTNTPAEQCAELKKKLVEKHQFKLSLKELENESTTLSMLLHVVRSTTTTDFLASLLALLQDISYGAIELEPLQREALSRVVKLLGRLTDILNKEVELELTTVLHLISRLMNTESIPYHGEPKEGLQVMGMLETRNMDFDNLLLLSVNEGKIPKITSTASSFIPNLLRKAFGMSYTDHQDSLYAYHFYHLLQRTKHVTLVYSAGKGNVSKNEVSRFVLQLLAEHPNSEQFRRIRLQPEFKVADIPPVKVEKSEQSIQEALNNIKSLSPSAINKYIDCQLRFYYDCVLKLKEEDELTDEIDNATMGNLFHKSMELCYKDIKKSKSTTQNAEEQDISITANDINALLLDKEHIRNIVLSAYNSVCFNNEKAPLIGEEKFSGEQKIYYTLIVDYVNRQLRVDLKQAPFTVRGLEKKHYVEHTLTDKSKTLEIGGILDRHDKADINGIEYDIIKDYKTSKAAQEIKNKKDESLIESLFNDKGKRPYHVFQILIYAWVLKKEGAKHIKPRLYYVNTFNNQDEKDYHKLGDIPFFDVYNDDMHKEFDEKLTKLLDEIFAVSKPFEPTNNTSHCKYCPYATICFKDKDSGDE